MPVLLIREQKGINGNNGRTNNVTPAQRERERENETKWLIILLNSGFYPELFITSTFNKLTRPFTEIKEAQCAFKSPNEPSMIFCRVIINHFLDINT